MARNFDSRPFDIRIEDGIVYLSWEGVLGRVMPLKTLKAEVARAECAIAAYEAGDPKVAPLKPGRTGRSAAQLAQCHRRAIFTSTLPDLQIVDGMAFLVVNAEGHCVCTSVHNFMAFLEEGRRKVVAWSMAQSPPLPFAKG